MSEQPKKYAFLGRRILNQPSGKMGTIASAKPRLAVKRGWEIVIEWDDGHSSGFWTDREISTTGKQLNKVVADDFVPNYGPPNERIRALIDRLDERNIRWVPGYGVEAPVGLDSLHIWKPGAFFEAQASLYGGQGKWTSEGQTEKIAWDDLRVKLTGALMRLEGGQS